MICPNCQNQLTPLPQPDDIAQWECENCNTLWTNEFLRNMRPIQAQELRNQYQKAQAFRKQQHEKRVKEFSQEQKQKQSNKKRKKRKEAPQTEQLSDFS